MLPGPSVHNAYEAAPLRLSSPGVIVASLCRARALLRPSHPLCLSLPSVLFLVCPSGHARHDAPVRARSPSTSISITPSRITYDTDKCIVGLIVYLYTVVDTSSYFGIHSSHLFWFTQFWISLPFVIYYYYYTMLLLPFLCLLHFFPAQNHPPTSPSPSAWRCSCPPPLDPIRESGCRPAPVGVCIRGPVLLELSVCLCFATYSYYMHLFGFRFWRAHPHPSPVFLTAVHRTVTYYSHVTCSVLDLPMSASLSTWSSFRGCPFRFRFCCRLQLPHLYPGYRSPCLRSVRILLYSTSHNHRQRQCTRCI
ncbi:hypothetical protein V8D89_014127 [Ganoderma adspersum]